MDPFWIEEFVMAEDLRVRIEQRAKPVAACAWRGEDNESLDDTSSCLFSAARGDHASSMR
jgi:hypothetical protein